MSELELYRKDKRLAQVEIPRRVNLLRTSIENLSEFFAVVHRTLSGQDRFWFRGQRDSAWPLIPSALRFDTKDRREVALKLLSDFRRIAEIKLRRPPGPDESLKWLQLAQHYGIPTRLLDWTESALFALYFACRKDIIGEAERDGIVYVLNPANICHIPGKGQMTSLDAHIREDLIKSYFKLKASEYSSGKPTLAIRPIWNSERLVVQRGTFTLHGTKQFALDSEEASSLVGIPILRENKTRLRIELESIGIDEMALFPELEHACNNLKVGAGLI